MAKVLVSLDDALLRRIDRTARAHGLTRSAYLAQLADHDLAKRAGPGTRAPVRRALAALDRLFAATPPGDTTADVRAARDAR
jgi:metal-responsive CopG/Arc/MetJ family transcriptional regulator